MAFIYDYGLFAAKSITLVTVIALGVITIIAAIARNKMRKGALDITDLSADYQKNKKHLIESLLNKEQRKAFTKEQKKEAKEQKKNAAESTKSRLFLIDFKGGMDAREVSSLREEITAVLTMAKSDDEVLIRVESGGGVVHGYGLGASQLQRIRDQGLYLTVSIDKVAASGGYMMACIGDKILSAPFAVLGSIGVVAQLPNIHRLLKKNNIDVEILTAGEHKRTLTMLGENTEQGREKFLQDLQTTHDLFKKFVVQYRPQLDIDAVATGEVWLGTDAREQQLVDQLQTSDEYLSKRAAEADLYALQFVQKKSLQERVGLSAGAALEHVADKGWERLQRRFIG